MRARSYKFEQAITNSVLLLGLMALVELVDFLIPFPLDVFGIAPRTVPGLLGIAFSPLLHANAAHLLANALPLFFLLIVLHSNPRYRPMQALAIIWLVSGFGTWLIGRGGAIHIGASSLIYGLVAYLICAGWWIRSWNSAIVSVLVLVAYGGIFYGMLPQKGPISWEGHLAGAVAGWWVARRNLA
ncbi:MAG: rhomboid family intramembrane serine protease [Verrucomicrobia bacterium]|nr:rhomboid family intramembrane serine protease [Verrucomicrobiota bacterium]